MLMSSPPPAGAMPNTLTRQFTQGAGTRPSMFGGEGTAGNSSFQQAIMQALAHRGTLGGPAGMPGAPGMLGVHPPMGNPMMMGAR